MIFSTRPGLVCVQPRWYIDQNDALLNKTRAGASIPDATSISITLLSMRPGLFYVPWRTSINQKHALLDKAWAGAYNCDGSSIRTRLSPMRPGLVRMFAMLRQDILADVALQLLRAHGTVWLCLSLQVLRAHRMCVLLAEEFGREKTW